MCGRDGSDIQKPSTLVLMMFKMRLRCGALRETGIAALAQP